MATTTEHKRGKLSTAECEFITDNVGTLTITKIAEKLNRTAEPVRRYIHENHLVSSSMTDDESTRVTLRSKLHSREYWEQKKKQFTQDELLSFETMWIELLLQFREDVLYAEELSITQYITLEILMGRALAEKQRAIIDIERLIKTLDEEYEKADDADRNLISNLEGQLANIRMAVPAYTTEYTKFLEKQQAISKDLKATRDQRIKRVEDSKSSWTGFLRALDDEETRARFGDEAELMRLAKDGADIRLAQDHVYLDGKIDKPLLNVETNELDNEVNNEQTEE